MGGRGRGVFSDFRLGRVRSPRQYKMTNVTYMATVPIQDKRASGQPTWCKEGELVDMGGLSRAILYIMTRHMGIRRRYYENSTLKKFYAQPELFHVTLRSFPVSALLPQQAGVNAGSRERAHKASPKSFLPGRYSNSA